MDGEEVSPKAQKMQVRKNIMETQKILALMYRKGLTEAKLPIGNFRIKDAQLLFKKAVGEISNLPCHRKKRKSTKPSIIYIPEDSPARIFLERNLLPNNLVDENGRKVTFEELMPNLVNYGFLESKKPLTLFSVLAKANNITQHKEGFDFSDKRNPFVKAYNQFLNSPAIFSKKTKPFSLNEEGLSTLDLSKQIAEENRREKVREGKKPRIESVGESGVSSRFSLMTPFSINNITENQWEEHQEMFRGTDTEKAFTMLKETPGLMDAIVCEGDTLTQIFEFLKSPQ